MVMSSVKKLRIQRGQRMLLLNAPEGFVDLLEDLLEDVQIDTSPDGKYDYVHFFVKDSAEYTEQSPVALAAITYDGMLWFSYPKNVQALQMM